MHYKSKVLLALPLFSVILIDSIGLSVIIPMLYPLIMDPDVSMLNHAVGSSTRYFYYNIAMCAFMIAWFFGSVILGDLSDKIGRRNSLLYSLMGFTLGFILSAVAVVTHSFWLLVI
ncbi:MAG: MFS transporter, partial [Pseudomonadota bacterium]|nr:MFS transporter [Pseudomonadota bacterium]